MGYVLRILFFGLGLWAIEVFCAGELPYKRLTVLLLILVSPTFCAEDPVFPGSSVELQSLYSQLLEGPGLQGDWLPILGTDGVVAVAYGGEIVLKTTEGKPENIREKIFSQDKYTSPGIADALPHPKHGLLLLTSQGIYAVTAFSRSVEAGTLPWSDGQQRRKK